MTYLSIAFLVLEILILAFAALLGYRRGIGRTAVRVVYLLIIGVGSFFAARAIAASVAGTVMALVHNMLPADVQALLAYSPELEPLVANIIGALAAPILFAVLFGLLQLITLIFFKKISTKIVSAITKDGEAPAWGKWVGAAAGLVVGFAIASALLCPLYLVLDVVDHVSDDTITVLTETIGEDVVVASAITAPDTLSIQPTTLALDIKPSFNAAKLFPWERPLVNALSTYNIHEQTATDVHESLTHSLPLIIDMAGDALRAYNYSLRHEDDEINAYANAASNIIPYLEETDTVKYLVTDAIHALGMALKEDHGVLGIELPETEDTFSKSLINHLVSALADTSEKTVKSNMTTLFGQPTIDHDTGEISGKTHNSGLLSTVAHLDAADPMTSLSSGDTTALMGAIAENENLGEMMGEIQDLTNNMIADSGIDLADQQYEGFYNGVKDDITSQITDAMQSGGDTSITDVAKGIEGTLDSYLQENEVELDPLQLSVISVSLAKEFTDEKYVDENGDLNVSVSDLMNFFGVDASQIPDWAQ